MQYVYGYSNQAIGCCLGDDTAGGTPLDDAIAQLVGTRAYAGLSAAQIRNIIMNAAADDEHVALQLAKKKPEGSKPTLYPGTWRTVQGGVQSLGELRKGTAVGAMGQFETPLGTGNEIMAAFLPRGWMSSFSAQVDRVSQPYQWGTVAFRGGDLPAWVVLTPQTLSGHPFLDAKKRRVRYIYAWVRDERTDLQKEADDAWKRAADKKNIADAFEAEEHEGGRIVDSSEGVGDGDEALTQRRIETGRMDANVSASAEADRIIAQMREQQRVQQAYNQMRGNTLPKWALPAGIGAAVLLAGAVVLSRRKG